MSGALAGSFVLFALLLGACTISSESPNASALGVSAGPSSGTTTTAGTGDTSPAASPAADEAEQPPTGEGAAAGGDGDGDSSPEAAGDAGAADSPEAGDSEQAPTPMTVAAGDETGAGEADRDATGEDTGQPETSPDRDAGTETPVGENAGGETPADGSETAPGTEEAAGSEATAAGEVAGGAFGERSKVSTVGIGAVYFGMSLEEAAERVGTTWAGVPIGGADCYVVTPDNGPPGVALWVYHGTVERVDIDTPLLRTQSGLGVGTHLNELRSRLGDKLVVEEHPYLAGWTLATFVPTDPNDAAFRIAFDISAGEVIRFHSGRTELVALESCA
jgi:hypothetical protein